METIILPGGKRTTRLGFGCSRVLPETRRLIEFAYDAGIRHFDVAPSYGRGMSESIVGEILGNKADEVSITTKYGIRPPVSNPTVANFVRSTLRPIVVRLPGIRKYVNTRLAANTGKVALSVPDIKASLDRSLRALKREKIDIFLLHEATAETINDENLVHFLHSCVEKGIIGAFGVGGERSNVDGLLLSHPAYCHVLQYDWSPIEKPEPFTPDLPIIFKTMNPANHIRMLFEANKLDQKLWSDTIGIDMAAPGKLELLLLKLSFEFRKEAIVLFSSTKEQNILANVAAVADKNLIEPTKRLMTLIQGSQQLFTLYAPSARG